MKKMESIYQPYIDPDFETLIERIYPPRVCIDNDTYKDCTLVKVDSANKHGILLEMVQVLTDLDLVISKSYISSDGGWFMDVFHVTDQLGNKITDESLIRYIQQELCASRRGISKELQTGLRREVRPYHVSTEHTALEMTGTDRPGLMSEITAALYDLDCHITAVVAWTHNARVACIMHVEDGLKGRPITDPTTLAHVEQQLELVVKANHAEGEKMRVRLTAPTPGRTHTERRLHQLMNGERDYERCRDCKHYSCGGNGIKYEKKYDGVDEVHVSVESCKEKDYSIVNVRSRDRPKLLFDTVCALTDMQYVVFHAVVGSKGFLADQEYFIRQKDGCTLDTEGERLKLSQCLIAAIERRVPHGLRLDVCTQNRRGLLKDITRVFRENSLSITRVEIGTHGGTATGSFYVTDISGHDPNMNVVEMVKKEVGEGTTLVVNKRSPDKVASHNRTSSHDAKNSSNNNTNSSAAEERPRFSLGSLLWSRLERISGNFGSIKS